MDTQAFNDEIKSIIRTAEQALEGMDQDEYNDFYGDYENHNFASACARCSNPDVARLGGLIAELSEPQYNLRQPKYSD